MRRATASRMATERAKGRIKAAKNHESVSLERGRPKPKRRERRQSPLAKEHRPSRSMSLSSLSRRTDRFRRWRQQ